MKKLLSVFVIIAIIGFPIAFAHPFTEKTIPAEFSNVPEGTNEVIVYYSEAVEIDFSSLKVLDSNGEQIDNKDTRYYEGDDSLIVTTPPLQEGVYTVASKVLSKVDGHLVPSAFVFAVGDIKIESTQKPEDQTEAIFYPEAASRFPGLVGQTIVLGSVIASIFIWGSLKKDSLKNSKRLEEFYHRKFLSITGIGLLLVFASNILMLTVQTLRLETSALDALQTTFGNTWIVRMTFTVALLVAWFVMEKFKKLSIKSQIPLLILSMALIGTTTLMGHGTASEQPSAVVLDYIHNFVSAVWIGGLIFLAFTLLPSISSLEEEKREKWSLVVIPKFSVMIIIAIGFVIISGPLLLYLLEDSLTAIIESTYGKLIILKIAIASVMVIMGGYHQFGIQRKAESDIKSYPVNKKLRRSLKVEASLGIALLAIVALLTNGTLPAGETQTAEAQIQSGISLTEFSENAVFDLTIEPFVTGANRISIDVKELDGNPLTDVQAVKVKISNPEKGIAPIEVPVEQVTSKEVRYQGEASFGFSGNWQVEIEAQRNQFANEGVTINVLVKPHLKDIKSEIEEFSLPEESSPLFPVFDGHGSIWISDASAPRIWKFSIDTKQFEEFSFDGQASITLEIDKEGNVWFTDIPEGRIGFVDPKSGKSEIVELPDIIPVIQRNFPIALEADNENNIWITIANKNVILRYDHQQKEFEEFELPTKDSGPFAVKMGPDGKIWFTEQTAGQIGYLDPKSGKIKEFSPSTPLSTPETITFDSDGNVWISEHQEKGSITKFNPFLESFERIAAPDEAAFPNSVVFDKYQNAWFAQHTVDKLAVYDPHRKTMKEIPIPTQQSWVQFLTVDDKGNVWFVEQQPYKLGIVKTTELPSSAIIEEQSSKFAMRYSEVAGPLMAMGIIATSLFFVKSVNDKRRISELFEE